MLSESRLAIDDERRKIYAQNQDLMNVHNAELSKLKDEKAKSDRSHAAEKGELQRQLADANDLCRKL